MSERDAFHKGWCPSMEKPMESGDGLLVRINIDEDFVSADNARTIAELAKRYGNSQIDLTSRGNLQIRGVTQENYAAVFNALTALGFVEQPRKPRPESKPLPELGYHNETLTLGLTFGRVSSDALIWLAEHATDGLIKLNPQRTVYLQNIPAHKAESLMAEAEQIGFITQTHDSRRFIEACPGAPACSSAQGETRALALDIAKLLPDLASSGKTIHVSGCIKGCACAHAASRVIVAAFGKYTLGMDAKADETPLLTMLSHESVLQVLTEWETP